MAEEIKVGSEVTVRCSFHAKDKMKAKITSETDRLWVMRIEGSDWTFSKKTLHGKNNSWWIVPPKS